MNYRGKYCFKRNLFGSKIKFLFLLILSVCAAAIFAFPNNTYRNAQSVYASNYSCAKMPFYDLQPSSLTLRSKFYTSYPASAPERKHNIKKAAEALNGVFIDAGGEFSFNRTVGERTEKNGYKKAKIIVNGRFVDGVGGGVCQVSTTLYNALLLGGIKITEYHAHSLPVSYIAPSFDAMVNSGSADLRFVNNTHNPLILYAAADDAQITISIFGESTSEKYVRQSIITEELLPPAEEITFDDELLYPDLYEGEKKVLCYGKKGYVSEGVLIKYVNGKPLSSTVIRKDRYNPTRGLIVIGRAQKTQSDAIS